LEAAHEAYNVERIKEIGIALLALLGMKQGHICMCPASRRCMQLPEDLVTICLISKCHWMVLLSQPTGFLMPDPFISTGFHNASAGNWCIKHHPAAN